MFPVLNQKSKIIVQPDVIILLYNHNNQYLKTNINDTAFQILKLCDGTNSIDDIINKMIKKYNEEESVVKNFVSEFINQSIKYGTISYIDIKNYKINIKGDRKYWTPEIAILELTYKCPLDCIHCYADAGNTKNNEMDFKSLDKILDEIIDLGIERVQLTGGEPLIYKNIEYVIKKLASNNIYINIITSGMIVKDTYKILKKLKNNKGSVQVSVDGLKERHNNYRNNKESFDSAINLIKFLVEENINIAVSTTFIDQGISEVEELCKYIKELEVPIYRLGFLFDQGRATDNKLDTTNDAFNQYKRLLEELKEKYNSDKFKVLAEESKDKSKINCGAGYRLIRITPEFKMTPCLMLDYCIGDLKNTSIRECLNVDNKEFSNILSPNSTICGNCINASSCEGCIAQGVTNGQKIKNCKWINSIDVNIVN